MDNKIVGKTKILNKVSKSTNLPFDACERVTDAFIDEIINSLSHGEKVVLKNFMVIEPSIRTEREGKDLATGETIVFPPIKTVKCKMSRNVKNCVKNGKW